MRIASVQRDNEILQYIEKYIADNGYAPSIRDICGDLGIRSTSTVHAALQRLSESGRIRFSPNLKRTIELTSKPHVANIPLVGTIAAGQPIFAAQNVEEVFPLPDGLFGTGELFMLRVRGESMIDAGIFDGDAIVVKQQPTADNGQIVAALIDDSATVKRFYKENGHFRLQPENEAMDPIICDDVNVLGIVVGLIRKL